MNRRTLIKTLAFAAPVVALLPRIAFAQKGGLTPLSEQEPLAKAMKYVVDASKAEPMRTDKTTFCSNCSKYNKCAPADTACKPGPKTAAVAPCEIFAGKTVAKAGWCLSWTKA